MRLQTIFSLVPLAFVLCLAITLTHGQAAKMAEPSLTELMTQRRDIFAQFVKREEVRYASGLSTLEDVLKAKGQLLEAELELAENKEQRLNVLQQRLKTMQAFEKQARARVERGRLTSDFLLQATAARLESQIALMREQQK